MSPEGPKSPNQKISKEKVRDAVVELCDKQDIPVVRPKDIANLDWVPVGKQAINNHLDTLEANNEINKLRVGKGAVWWVPENKAPSGEIEVSAINWGDIEAGEIPDDLVMERPEVEDPTYWEGMRDNWGQAGGGGGFILLSGAMLMIIAEYSPFQPFDLQPWAVLFFIGGFVLMAVSIVLIFLAKMGQILEDRGVLPAIRGKLAEVRDSLLRKVLERLPSDIEENSER